MFHLAVGRTDKDCPTDSDRGAAEDRNRNGVTACPGPSRREDSSEPKMIREANYYAQLAAGLARWVREPIIPDPDAAVREMVLHREANFLELMGKAVFAASEENSLNALLRHAGCEHGDLVRLVQSRRLEGALGALCESGVYMTHDEFKGHVPLQRGALRIDVDSSDLANPLYKPTLEASSSGSRSRGTVTRRT